MKNTLRTMILSFTYKWHQPLVDGRKKFEHRKRFCDETVKAYIYLGVLYRQLVAVAEFGKRILLSDWLEEFSNDKAAILRIKDFMNRNNYAMSILNVQEIEPIDIRYIEKIDGFRAPISYRFLNEQEEILHYIETHTKLKGEKIVHDFRKVTSNDVCLF